MNLTSGHPFWSVNNGLPANYPSLQRNVSCDAVVIGGGITGTLVAVHLVEAGIKTLVIDKRDIGTGSTSASTALLQYEIDVPVRELIKKVGPTVVIGEFSQMRQRDFAREQRVIVSHVGVWSYGAMLQFNPQSGVELRHIKVVPTDAQLLPDRF